METRIGEKDPIEMKYQGSSHLFSYFHVGTTPMLVRNLVPHNHFTHTVVVLQTYNLGEFGWWRLRSKVRPESGSGRHVTD